MPAAAPMDRIILYLEKTVVMMCTCYLIRETMMR